MPWSKYCREFLWPSIVALLLVLSPLVLGAFRFIQEPSDPSYFKKGSNATLVWDYSVDNQQTELEGVIWSVNTGSQFISILVKIGTADPIPHPDIPSAYKGRVHIQGRASLIITNVSFQDNTVYRCTLSAKPGSRLVDESSDVTLIVTEPPVVSPVSVAGSYSEGFQVSISCQATGTPDPDVTWIRNGQVKSTGKKSALLTFSSIFRTNSGQYTCNANNSAGSTVEQVTLVVRYPAGITSYSPIASKSWIGQIVKFKCVSYGVPTPTVAWFKPDGNELLRVTANENTEDVNMTRDRDFGDYKCMANNGLSPVDTVTITVQQIKEPGAPEITSSDADIQATSLTVKWGEPTDDGGSPISAYRVVILRTGTEIRNENITDPSTTSLSVGGLDKDTKYIVKVFARNFVFEGPAGSNTVQTKYEGIPEAAELIDVPIEVKGEKLILKWVEPPNNGEEITQYTVYKRTVNSNGTTGDWTTVVNITDVSVREYTIKLNNCEICELLVTATNKFGEALKLQEKVQRFKVTSGSDITQSNRRPDNQTGSTCKQQCTTLHAVYLAVIAVLLLMNIVFCWMLWRIRRSPEFKRADRKTCSRCEEVILMNSMAAENSVQSTSSAKPVNVTYEIPESEVYTSPCPSSRSWEMKRKEVNIIKVIGKGALSQVAKATAQGISEDKGEMTVAVKMLKADAPESDRKDLLSELELMKKMKPHPHVIKLIGCVTESDPLLVVIEYVPHGDLLGYLRKSRGLNDTYFKDPDVKPQTSLTAEQLLRFAWQIADGMCYLSSRKIVHRDLAARNVLVGEGEKCKVTDFGMSRDVERDDIYTRKSRGRLPVKWTAYEALLYGTYTTQSDVWSYGVVLYEILTVGGTPYPDIHGRQIANKLQEGYRMPKPQHVDSKLYQVMLQCWQESPKNRPTFTKLKETMKEMEKNHRTYVNLKQYDNSLYANVKDLNDG